MTLYPPSAQGSASGGDMSAVEQLEAQLKGILASLNKIDVVGQPGASVK